MEQQFLRWKQQSLSRMDQSRKGNLDPGVQHLVHYINSWPQYVTTSSCSGRIVLIDGDSEVQKLNCFWLFVSHDHCSAEQLMSGLSESSRDVVLKFEPFVLHVQCRKLEDAQLMHCVSVASGFRNSGMSVGKTGKIMAAVRSTHTLEVPLSLKGKLLVGREYIDFLVQVANQKMDENLRRIHRFQQNLQTALSSPGRQNLQTALSSPGRQNLQTALSSPGRQDLQTTLSSPGRQDLQLHSDVQEERKESDVYKRRRRRDRHQTDRCHGDGDGRCHGDGDGRCHGDGDGRCHGDGDDGVTELDGCLDLLLGNGSE